MPTDIFTDNNNNFSYKKEFNGKQDISLFTSDEANIFGLRNMLNMNKQVLLQNLNTIDINNVILKYSLENSLNPALIEVKQEGTKMQVIAKLQNLNEQISEVEE
ncbi:hypothetical protein ACFX5K_00130 [Rickettsiales bacterium LUAb2]